MCDSTKFKAVLWHPRDGVRNVVVKMVAGVKPFAADPSEVGVQLLVCDPGDSDKALAVLHLDPEATDRLGYARQTLASFASDCAGAIKEKARQHGILPR
jgi:hypothetical protein